MKIDFDQKLADIRSGAPLPEDASPNSPAATLRYIALSVLLTSLPEDAQKAGHAYKLYTLAHRIKDGGEVDLSTEDASLIKERVEKCFAPQIVGQVWDMMDLRDAPIG